MSSVVDADCVATAEGRDDAERVSFNIWWWKCEVSVAVYAGKLLELNE